MATGVGGGEVVDPGLGPEGLKEQAMDRNHLVFRRCAVLGVAAWIAVSAFAGVATTAKTVTLSRRAWCSRISRRYPPTTR
ncbi:hypothetical protein [Acidiferrobacter sp.]|jgi:hypothetical protein|uniref:hypothetical protein n=1 Tax=Acidiferrobacter sp. TaxID=1872107 RepID=UPI00262D7E67|nr:hypothetical protein [Acidiferrobacter sp.]